MLTRYLTSNHPPPQKKPRLEFLMENIAETFLKTGLLPFETFVSNSTAKTKLAILAFLDCETFVKN